MAIRVLELHHHAVRVGPTQAQADAVRDFYVNVLGLSTDPGRPGAMGIPGYWVDVGARAQVHLMGAAGVMMDLGEGLDPSCPHVALAVEDIAAARAELDRLGVTYGVTRGLVGPGSEQVFLRDPAGNLVELHQTGSCRCVAEDRDGKGPHDAYTRTWSAVMFADMRGFTGLSERLAPARVVPLLNDYFTLLTSITTRHGGTVFSMAGDGLMVGFGVPEEQPDSSERAVDAAREMLDGFRGLADDWKLRHDVDTGLGVGINAGEVIAGNVGPSTYRNYTIIGDTVNVAARLGQRARAGEALFSSTVKRSLDEHGRVVTAIELPPLVLRGRASPVDIFCIPTARRIDLRPPPASPAP
jgi:class 3 adenylate cyclase